MLASVFQLSRRTAGLLALAAFAAACGTGSAGDAMPQGVMVRVDPVAPRVIPGAPVAFVAAVTGTPTLAVTWSVSEQSGGTIDSTGLYTAPRSPGTYHVEVRSVGDPTASAVATVTVAEPASVQFLVGGTVSGLAGTGLVLSMPGQADLAVPVGATSFTFGSPMASGSAYSVTVKTQPTSRSQICTVANGSGTMGGSNVTNVTVTCANTPSGTGGTLAQQLAADMTGSNEAFPHGVPTSWDWAQGPVLNRGNNPVYNGITAAAATTWGLVYEAAQGNPATNSRVNLRNVRLLFKSKRTGQWSILQSTSNPDGSNYYEDFSGDSSFPPDVRTESDGTISVKVGGGYMFHLFPSRRASFDPTDIGGWIAIFEGRLILDDPARPDDRSTAQLLAAAGADYWPSTTSNWGSAGAPSIADGKLKYVKPYWRWYAITSLSEAELEANPPPLQLAGISP